VIRRLLLPAVVVAGLLAAAAPSGRAQDQGFAPIPLKKIAAATSGDPLAIWSDQEVREVVAGTPNIFAGSLRTNRGTVVVSQLVGRGLCDTPQDCPVRVVLQDPAGKRRVLLEREQLCASPNFYSIRPDLQALRACDRVVDLP
jgi:hypothetical protein